MQWSLKYVYQKTKKTRQNDFVSYDSSFYLLNLSVVIFFNVCECRNIMLIFYRQLMLLFRIKYIYTIKLKRARRAPKITWTLTRMKLILYEIYNDGDDYDSKQPRKNMPVGCGCVYWTFHVLKIIGTYAHTRTLTHSQTQAHCAHTRTLTHSGAQAHA